MATLDAPLLDLIYETVVQPDLWDSVIERIADGMGGEGGALIWQDFITNVPSAIMTRLDPEAVDLFSSHFATRNPLRPPAADVRRQMPRWKPAVVLDEQRLPKSEFMKTEFYNDFFRRYGFHSSAAIGLELEGVNGATLDILRSRSRGAFTNAELDFVKASQPHLHRAFKAGRSLAAASAPDLGASNALEHWKCGVFILSSDGRVRRMNVAAEGFMRGDALRIIEGRLAALDFEADRRLKRLIGRAGADGAYERSAGFMAAPAPSRRLPLSLSVLPMRTERHPLFAGPSIMVCVTDPDRGSTVEAGQLREVFGLTATETKVALGLLEGLQTSEVAARLGSSINTVRNHLARILEKTHSSGQAELSRRLMNLS